MQALSGCKKIKECRWKWLDSLKRINRSIWTARPRNVTSDRFQEKNRVFLPTDEKGNLLRRVWNCVLNMCMFVGVCVCHGKACVCVCVCGAYTGSMVKTWHDGNATWHREHERRRSDNLIRLSGWLSSAEFILYLFYFFQSPNLKHESKLRESWTSSERAGWNSVITKTLQRSLGDH